MKKLTATILMGMTLTLINVSFAYNYSWCERKIANLENQMKYAQQYNNQGRIYGLKKAIANVKYKCGTKADKAVTSSDVDIEASIDHEIYDEMGSYGRREHLQDKVLKYKKKVIDAEYEVEKAKLRGEPQRIREKELKLKRRQDTLKLYEDELKGL